MEHLFGGGYPRQLLEEVLEPEMAKQYRLRWGEQCRYVPLITPEGWLCSCGCENAPGADCSCGLAPRALSREVLEQLRQEAAPRLEQEEKEQAEQSAREQAESGIRERRRRRRRVRRWCVGIGATALVLTAAVWCFFAAVRSWIPAGHYADALEALERGALAEAHRSFQLAGNYQDAPQYLSRFQTPHTQMRVERQDDTRVYTYTYTDDGQLQSTHLAVYTDFGLVGEQWLQNTYDPRGLITRQEGEYGATTYEYDDRGDKVYEECTKPDDHYTTVFYYEYDDQDRLSRRAEVCTNSVSLTYSYEQIDTYTYNNRGQVLSHSQSMRFPASVDNNYQFTTHYIYDGDGRLLEEREELTGENDPTIGYHKLVQYTCDGAGRLTKSQSDTVYPLSPDRDNSSVEEYRYDEAGRTVFYKKSYLHPSDPVRNWHQQETHTYNSRGYLTASQYSTTYDDPMRQDLSGSTQTVQREYDLFDRLTVERAHWQWVDGEEEYIHQTYTYSGSGLATACREEQWETGGEKQTVTYTLNENGLPEKMVTDTATTYYTYAYFYEK